MRQGASLGTVSTWARSIVPWAGLAAAALAFGRQQPSEPTFEPPADLKTLHKDEMEAFAKRLEKAGRPERANDLRKRWLDTKRRETLDPRDADARIALGDQYESLIDDKRTAASLYLEALDIDPNQKRAIDGLNRLGYRREKNRWIAPASLDRPLADRPAVEPAGGAIDAGNGLKGLSREEVLARLGGKPDRIVRAGSQGRVIEQWIYRGPRESQYIDFEKGGDRSRPIVIDHFTLAEPAGVGSGR